MVMPVIQYAPETCAWCAGAGKYGDFNDACLVCTGQGSLMVAQPARRCPRCNGSGVDESSEYHDRCRTCNGAGWSHVFKQNR
jgi:DnaJ-class molecular chaperone